jgi:DGQHR domain-containing protein
MVVPLIGVAGGDDLKAIYAKRSKAVDEKTISAATKDAFALKLAGEQADGWRVSRKNKRSIRLVKDKPIDRKLEDDVWTLFYRMGFKELNIDRQFTIQASEKTPPRQLDVFAKDNETVFIVECTHSRETGPKSLKALLDKLGAMREDVVKAVHGYYGREPRLKIKLGIATRNIEWRTADRQRAEAAGIAIITEHDLAYFEKLTGLLKSAARYQFLGRYLSGEKVEGLRTKLPATKGKAGGRVFYNFLISPHELLRISYINHKSRSSNDDFDTYQRMVKPNRLKAIGRYIDEGGKFPTNIVINFKLDGLQFDQKEEFGDTATGILHLPGQYGSAWVIDGQHRLYGYAHAQRSEEQDSTVVTVLAYENIPIREEIKLFVDINTEQVKVSRNLVNEILSSLDIDDPDPKKRLDALYARIALRLDEYVSSPLSGRIVTVSQEKDHYRCLTLTSLADQIGDNALLGTIHRPTKNGPSHWMPGLLAHLSGDAALTMEKAVVTLSLYLTLFSKDLEGQWQLGDDKGGYLCTNNGIRALIMLLRKLLSYVENRDGVRMVTMSPEDIVERIEPLVRPVVEYFKGADSHQINAFRSRGSSLLSVGQNCLQMMSLIHEATPDFLTPEVRDYMNSRDVAGTKQAKDMIDEINKIIFEDVIATLKEKFGTQNEAWWLQGVPKGVRNNCDALYNENNGERERHRYLFLANYPEILLYGQNWELFKDYYNFYGKGKKADLVRWIGKINKARTITHHAEKGPLTKEDVDFVRTVHQLVKTHIEGRKKVDGKENYLASFATKDAGLEAAA